MHSWASIMMLTKKATLLFFDSLKSFDQQVATSPDRKVIMKLDSCSAHGCNEILTNWIIRRFCFGPKYRFKDTAL